MVWGLTGAGWIIIGAVTGWHAADFAAGAGRLHRGLCGALGAVGGPAGGAAIILFGVGSSDPEWLLSMITCAVGAVGAVMIGAACVSPYLKVRRRS